MVRLSEAPMPGPERFLDAQVLVYEEVVNLAVR